MVGAVSCVARGVRVQRRHVALEHERARYGFNALTILKILNRYYTLSADYHPLISEGIIIIQPLGVIFDADSETEVPSAPRAQLDTVLTKPTVEPTAHHLGQP